MPAIAIWQGFSGNNSGECVLVAKFHTVAAAESYLAELLPGWPSDTGYRCLTLSRMSSKPFAFPSEIPPAPSQVRATLPSCW